MQERTTQYVLSGVGGDGSLQRLPFVRLEVFAVGFITFSRLPHEFSHYHFAMTSAEELSASILVNHVGENSERQPRTIVLMVWLCLLSYLPTAFSAASAKPQFQETALFAGAQQGIHTYRIPSMISTRKGTTLVSCEGRRYDRSPMQSSSSGVSETPALQTRSERSTSRPRDQCKT